MSGRWTPKHPEVIEAAESDTLSPAMVAAAWNWNEACEKTFKQSKSAKIGSLYVAPTGEALRLERVSPDYLTEEDRVKYSVLTLDGYQSVRYDLPEGSTLVWEPTT